MDKNLLGSLLAVPVLLAFGGFPSGGGCNYTKPDLVFAVACTDDGCRAAIRKHLPACTRRYASDFTTTVRHEDGVARAPRLTLAMMDKLTDCMASASYGAFDRASLDLSDFREVSKDVRGDTAKPAGGGLYLYPVVGQTTFLYGPT
ncbi:MAG: hypothetical protein AAF251_15220 [Pseudomonadota bacterium]